MLPIILAIDPGKTGALATFNPHVCGIVEQWTVTDCPTVEKVVNKKKRNVPDPGLMALALRPYAGGVNGDIPVHCYIEHVQAMPQEGAVGAFNFGKGYGAWLGVLAALGIPYTIVMPQKWKKPMVGVGKSKEDSRQRALQMFPFLADHMRFKKNDGRAEALLICEWGRREQEAL